MYSMVLMMAVTGPVDATAFGHRGGGCGGSSCHGTSYTSCGGYSAGCGGSTSCHGGNSCHGGRGGFLGGRKHGHGCTGNSCHGSSCHGYTAPAACGCCGTMMAMPAGCVGSMMAPVPTPVPTPAKDMPKTPEGGGAGTKKDGAMAPATLSITAPATAVVMVDGVNVVGGTDVRRFVTLPVSAATYTVKADIAGKTVTKTVAVTGGQEVAIDLTAAETVAAK